MQKIAFFHTTMNTPLLLKQAFEARYPGVRLMTVMDDSIVPEVIENGNAYTPGIVRKLIQFATEAQIRGASAAVCMCTTITGAVAQAAKAVDIPFVTIDGPMLAEAARAGERIALLITANTTYKASSDSMAEAIVRSGKENITFDTILCEGAFEALNIEHDKEKHDEIIRETAHRAAETHDVIVLAQVSMVDAAKGLEELGKPVLTSLESGLAQIKDYL